MSGGTGYVSEGFEYRLLEIVTQNLEFTWRFEGRGVGREALLGSLDRMGIRRFFRDVMTPMRPRLHKGSILFARIEPGVSSLDTEIFDWNPEAIGEPCGSSLDFIRTVVHLPRQDYYRYQFGFRILPLRSLPLSSSCVVFYFCRKSLTGLEGAGVGVMTQVPGLRCFPRTFHIGTLGPRCALGRTEVLGSFDSILRLAHTHSFFMSHTRFDSLWACRCGGATFMRIGQDRRSLET
ncbi:hypothetical protein DY000_02014975 [Brassica cretica]|uniref:Uncharacterized protein n=1 Tax=Brassica cretica TaxID=69181 RepID=A0ABQ7CY21_BRACR|nr:hypothetical protein DY000_02014975 [Brassica cretica]